MIPFETFTNENIKKRGFRKLRSQVMLRASGRCEECGYHTKHRRPGSMYVVPRKEIPFLKPEEYAIDNLQMICKGCYRKKKEDQKGPQSDL